MLRTQGKYLFITCTIPTSSSVWTWGTVGYRLVFVLVKSPVYIRVSAENSAGNADDAVSQEYLHRHSSRHLLLQFGTITFRIKVHID